MKLGESEVVWKACTRAWGVGMQAGKEEVWFHYYFGSDRSAGALMKSVPLGQSL